jgi:uncharacterized membrane protein YhaH (DUF805 family)
MELVDSYVHVLKNYVGFSGRARRREYWLFVLANLIIAVVLWFLSLLPIIGGVFTVISRIYTLVALLPWLAVAVRRIHDTGHSGLWLVILLGVPCLVRIVDVIWMRMAVDEAMIVNAVHYEPFLSFAASVASCLGGIVYLIWMVIAGEARDNRFGPDPKSVA